MNSRPQPHFRTAAFTLIELLTVITIIAILMGLLFPAIGIAKDQARKAEAKAAVTGIAAAVKQYYTEYGKYPLGIKAPDPSSPSDVLFGETGGGASVAGSNQIVFNILRNAKAAGDTNDYNPRGIVFFDGKIASDKAAPKSGFVPQGATTGTTGAFIDPWGKEYYIAIDADYNNIIDNLPYTDFKDTGNASTTPAPLTGVAVFSIGKDNTLGSTKTPNAYRSSGNVSDDIVSWQ